MHVSDRCTPPIIAIKSLTRCSASPVISKYLGGYSSSFEEPIRELQERGDPGRNLI